MRGCQDCVCQCRGDYSPEQCSYFASSAQRSSVRCGAYDDLSLASQVDSHEHHGDQHIHRLLSSCYAPTGRIVRRADLEHEVVSGLQFGVVQVLSRAELKTLCEW